MRDGKREARMLLAEQADIERVYEWASVLDDSSYYELLGVLEIADDAALKEAFHEFALAFHPDAHRDHDPELTRLARLVFQRGAEAYRVLSHPDLRPRYDLALAKGQLRLLGRGGARGGQFGGGAHT